MYISPDNRVLELLQRDAMMVRRIETIGPVPSAAMLC